MSYVHHEPQRHRCRPPNTLPLDAFEFDADVEFPVPRLKTGVRLPRVGDVWECECGRTHVLSSCQHSTTYWESNHWHAEDRFARWRRKRRTRRRRI